MDFVKSTFVLVLFLTLQTVCVARDSSWNGLSNLYDNTAGQLESGLATWVYVIIAISSLIGVAIIVSIIVCCVCCARSGSRRPVQVIQPPMGQVFYTAAAAQQPVTADGMQYNPNGQNFPMQQLSPGPAHGQNYPIKQSLGPDDRQDNPRQQQSSDPDDRRDYSRQERSPGPAYGQDYSMQQSSSGPDDRWDNPRQQRSSGAKSYPRNNKY